MSNVNRPDGGYGASDYIRRAKAGMSQAEAARDMGVTREAVRQMAVKYNITFRDGRGSDNEGKYLGLHDKGLANDEIANICGVSPSAVSLFFSARGIKRNSIARSKYADELRRMEKEGYTTKEAANELGIRQPAASALCKRLGVKLADGRKSKPSKTKA